MANKQESQARLNNILMAGNLYTNHKINKNLEVVQENQQRMTSAINSGLGKLEAKAEEANELTRKGNRLAEGQLRVQSEIAEQQQVEYEEKQQNELIRDTFFNISEEYEKLCKNKSEDLLNKYFKLTSLLACIKKNNIDSSIASSMEDKKFISNVLENIESDINTSQNAFNDQHKKDFEEVLGILETDEESEIRETKKEIKTKKNSIREDEKIIADHEKIINNFKTWVNECVENPLYSLVILFKQDQAYFENDRKIREKAFISKDDFYEEFEKEEKKIKDYKKEYMDEGMCDGLVLKYVNDCKYATEKIPWFNDLEYARGNIFYPACFYYKTLERYKHLLNKKNEGVGFISSIIEKNASKLGVDYFLKVRADLIYRLINEKQYKNINEGKTFFKRKAEKKLSEIIVQEDMINDHKSSLQPLIKIITKALELLEEKCLENIKAANERISTEKSNIQELENKNNEAQKVISQEQRQANVLYKKYPFIKEILTNRV